MGYLCFKAFIFLCSSYHGLFAASVSEISNVIHLGMVESSAAYIFSQSDESDQIAIESIQHDRGNKLFDDVWSNAERNMKCKIPNGLKREYVLALYAYTAEYPEDNPFYKVFNEEVRKYGATDEIYAKNFKYKSFQYLLTVAVEQLKDDSGRSIEMTYRVMRMLAEGTEGTEMRFGSFASSSLEKNATLNFINEKTKSNTLFEMHTTYGARIMHWSCFPAEKEVLIPPYEVFRIGKTVPWKYGNMISLTGQRKQGVWVKLEMGKDGALEVVRSEGVASSAFMALWVLAAMLTMSM